MKHNFKPYLNPIFIESGSYCGDGIKAALDAGFKKIISIELSEYYFIICREMFHQENVFLYKGDSIDVLPKILKDINEKCTFWLDGHYMSDPRTGNGIMPVPLWEELKNIDKHPIKEHIILIDDIRLLRNHDAEFKNVPYNVCDVENFIYSINPNYKIHYEDGCVEKDILIAQI